MSVKVEALKDLFKKVEAGEIIQAYEASAIWPTTYDKQKGHNVLIWQDACRASQGSLDAAKALHEAVLLGWGFVLWTGGKGDFAVTVSNAPPGAPRIQKSGKSNSPARAWLLAILKALIAQEETP